MSSARISFMLQYYIANFNVILNMFLHSPLLPTALTVGNVLRELKNVSWKTLSNMKILSNGITKVYFGVLCLSDSQRHKIESEYSTEDQRKKAAVQFWLTSDAFASWRRLITQLDLFEEHVVAKQIHCYAEKLTGMTCTLQIGGCHCRVCSGRAVCTTLSGSPLTLYNTITCLLY